AETSRVRGNHEYVRSRCRSNVAKRAGSKCQALKRVVSHGLRSLIPYNSARGGDRLLMPVAAPTTQFCSIVPGLAVCVPRPVVEELHTLKFILLLMLAMPLCAAVHKVDVVVYGGTPGGIASAIAAARMGHSVVLLEYHNHLGGMSASGLGKSDVEHREAIGGFFREFTGKVHRYYIEKYGADSENVKLCRQGYYYEPSVAEHIFEEMLTAETRIRVFKNYRLDEVMRQANRLTGIRATNRTTGDAEEFRGTIFIDGTYERSEGTRLNSSH